MAWLDDRVWCHPKITELSVMARWVWVAGICYSSGFLTLGRLGPEHQKLIGCGSRIRDELVTAGLWLDVGSGWVEIRDWDQHNDKRDARRAWDRERKRKKRLSGGSSTGMSTGQIVDFPRVEGSEGSDG